MANRTPLTRHPHFYFSYGTDIFRVQDTLYKLCYWMLVEDSAFFTELFHIGSIGPKAMKGKSDEDPIDLGQDLTVEVFDLFVGYKFGW